jgi:hypothetical protein
VVQALAASVGFNKMRPEAAIVNFYRADKSVMGAHLDDAEEEMRVPIVSLSFGCSAIFLLGKLSPLPNTLRNTPFSSCNFLLLSKHPYLFIFSLPRRASKRRRTHHSSVGAKRRCSYYVRKGKVLLSWSSKDLLFYVPPFSPLSFSSCLFVEDTKSHRRRRRRRRRTRRLESK